MNLTDVQINEICFAGGIVIGCVGFWLNHRFMTKRRKKKEVI